MTRARTPDFELGVPRQSMNALAAWDGHWQAAHVQMTHVAVSKNWGSFLWVL